MKKLMFLLVALCMMATQLAFSQTTYTIPYAMGVDTLQVKSGYKITTPLVFYEKEDQFTRGDPMLDRIIPFSSHGLKFWLKDVKMREDTTGSVTILSAIVVDPPIDDLVVLRDDRTGGDMWDPDEKPSPTSSNDLSSFPWPLASGLALLALYGIARWRRWV